MGVLQRAQEIPRQGVDHGDRAGSPQERALQPLAVDPVADPVGQLADDPGVVDVPDRRVVQPAERLGLPNEPGPGRLVGVEVHPQADPALQDQIVGFEEDPLRRYRYRPLEPVAAAERLVGALEVAVRLDAGQRSNPRRRSTFTCRPHTAALHQRRP